MRTPAENAELALLLEVAATPKPGNVDRRRDLPDLRFEHFLAGAVGAGAGLRAAAGDCPLGEAFERAVGGMAAQTGGNTQFGGLLLLVPLVRAAAGGGALSRTAARTVAGNTTVDDAAAFYRAFEHVGVFAGDPPAETPVPDVRRGADAVGAVRERELTLTDVLAAGADHDDVAREWTTGFERSFAAADLIVGDDGPVPDRAARAFLGLLSRRPDTLIAKKHGEDVAAAVTERAAAARQGGPDLVRAFADALVAEEINPGATADITAAGLFVALQRDGIAV